MAVLIARGLQRRRAPRRRVHGLRHTCASLLIREGAGVMAVSKQLGHSTPTVTLNVYSHLFDDDLDRLFAGLDELVGVPERATRGPKAAEAEQTTAPPTTNALRRKGSRMCPR